MAAECDPFTRFFRSLLGTTRRQVVLDRPWLGSAGAGRAVLGGGNGSYGPHPGATPPSARRRRVNANAGGVRLRDRTRGRLCASHPSDLFYYA